MFIFEGYKNKDFIKIDIFSEIEKINPKTPNQFEHMTIESIYIINIVFHIYQIC